MRRTARLAAVASRDLERCRQFIAQCQRTRPLILRRALAAATRSCWPATTWMPCTSPCPRASASTGRFARPRRASTCWSRSRRAATRPTSSEILARLPAERRAVHGRRDVHAQPAARRACARCSTTARASGRSSGSRPSSRFGARGVLPAQHPHPQPAGAARLPGRLGLVQHPLHARG